METAMGGIVVVIVLAFVIIVIVAKTAVVVPQQSAYVVERLGKYSGTLGAGFHILIPFLDVVRYKHSLKEQAVDIPPQVASPGITFKCQWTAFSI
jgi:regulator of protease activity HflC (stomatin/prohibitin superfamily)